MAATVTGERQRASLACWVENLSEGGAFLALDEPSRAPAEVRVALSDGPRAARVVWRSETGIGVAFAQASPASTPERRSADVVSLDAVRRQREGISDEQRLAERIARFVRPSRRPDLA